MVEDRTEPDWQWVCERLGSPSELEASAFAHGALLRRREIRNAASLLRLCLGYGCGLSLREAAGWAAMSGIAQMSDVAVMKRLRGAADWLGHLAGQVLARRVPEAKSARPIRIVDGSMVSAPGGALWRLHVAYDPGRQCFTHVELTDRSGAERLERAPVAADEIRIGDRCYARPEGIRQLREGGGDFIVRIGWKSLTLKTPDGAKLDVPALLNDLAPGSSIDLAVQVTNGRNARLPPIEARLIVIPKKAEAAAHARRHASRTSRKAGNRIAPQTLRAADHLMLLTSLEAKACSSDEVAALYRLRWQVELAFKRLKSLLNLTSLPARDVDLARTWLLAKLLMALLIEESDQDLLDSPPSTPARSATPLPLAPR